MEKVTFKLIYTHQVFTYKRMLHGAPALFYYYHPIYENSVFSHSIVLVQKLYF